MRTAKNSQQPNDDPRDNLYENKANIHQDRQREPLIWPQARIDGSQHIDGTILSQILGKQQMKEHTEITGREDTQYSFELVSCNYYTSSRYHAVRHQYRTFQSSLFTPSAKQENQHNSNQATKKKMIMQTCTQVLQ